MVDCYDALTSDRPYRPRMTREQAEQVLLDRRGSMYDPWVVDEFLRILVRLENEASAQSGEMSSDSNPVPSRAQLDVISATTAEEREFNELRRQLPKAGTLPAAADVLFRHLRRIIPAACFVLFAPGEEDELGVLACSGIGASTIRDVRIRIGSGTSGWSFAHNQTVINSDATLDLGPVARGFPVPLTHTLAVPLSDAAPYSVITAYGTDPFKPDHRRLLENAATLFCNIGPNLRQSTDLRGLRNVTKPAGSLNSYGSCTTRWPGESPSSLDHFAVLLYSSHACRNSNRITEVGVAKGSMVDRTAPSSAR